MAFSKEEAMNNPYPKVLIDEDSGVEVPDDRHRIWEKAHQAALQAVGEWLKSRLVAQTSLHYAISPAELEALLRGEMPTTSEMKNKAPFRGRQ